jgi:broad specificity phosphatase PhoE
MKLILVRHGESTENQKLHEGGDPTASKTPNPPLTKIGFQQAYETGGHLRATPTLRLWTSLLQRARYTADCIRDFQPDIDLTGMPDLNEKNERVAGVRRKETMEEFTERVAQFRGLIDDCEVDVLVVGHSVFISVLTSLLLNESVQEPLVYRNPNCAITRFEREDGKWKLLEQGSVEHLSEHIRTGVDPK